MSSDTAVPIRPGPAVLPWWRRDPALAGWLVIAVFLVYAGTRAAGFIWDDASHLTANPCIIGPLGLKEIWTTTSANYFPLVLTSLWLQHALWGLAPAPYHFVSVALHATTAVLLWVVLRRLNVRGSWVGAALWALHPVQVESVAWISELKNTQSAIFYVLTAWLYLRWSDAGSARKDWRGYVLVLVCFALALLSKPSTVMLPVALLLCDWWRRQRWSWRSAVALLPLFGLAAIAGFWTIWEQKFHSFAVGPDWNLSIDERAAIAGKSVWFYLEKLVWPDPLVFIYPRWSTSAGNSDVLPFFAAFGVLGWLWWETRRGRARGAFFALTYFVALLFPVIGFFDVYFFRYSFVADHFQYLASMGPLAYAGAILAVASDRLARFRPAWRHAPPIGVMALAALSSWREIPRFRDSAALWQATQRRNPNCWIADTILGDNALQAGRTDEALRLQRHALQLYPRSFEAHYNLGLSLVKVGRIDEAIAEYRRALQIKPNFADAENNLGVALVAAGRPREAIPHYQRAIELDPLLPEPHFLLGLALTLTGQPAAAVDHFQTALKLRPNYPEAHYGLAVTADVLGRAPDAISHYRMALQLRPDFRDAHTHLAGTLFRTHDLAGAAREFAAALKLQPSDAIVRADFATVLLAGGNPAAAITQYEAALKLNPQLAPARYNLAIALRATGRAAEAEAQAREARRLDPKLPPLGSK